MRVLAASLLAAAAVAVPELNSHYDNHDIHHEHYGSATAASPAYPAAPDFNDAVAAFDSYGTLFGEHRYQLQVAKTGNMLIGTEALRESIDALQRRVALANEAVRKNDFFITHNDDDISWNRIQIAENRDRLFDLDNRVHDLEHGYDAFSMKLAVDREAIIMMCHQYAYAETIPAECEPFIGTAGNPIPYVWNWPTEDCAPPVPLPPFFHEQPVYPNPLTPDTYVPSPPVPKPHYDDDHHYEADQAPTPPIPAPVEHVHEGYHTH